MKKKQKCSHPPGKLPQPNTPQLPGRLIPGKLTKTKCFYAPRKNASHETPEKINPLENTQNEKYILYCLEKNNNIF